jgi:nitrite reductase/ring-hydroxylating ferredoxin subunit
VPLGVDILGSRVVLFRDEGGIRCLDDTCPHRCARAGRQRGAACLAARAARLRALVCKHHQLPRAFAFALRCLTPSPTPLHTRAHARTHAHACAHAHAHADDRAAPLSEGWLSDPATTGGHTCVVCPYHGWAIDGAGRLQDVPSATPGRWPKRPIVSSYPVRCFARGAPCVRACVCVCVCLLLCWAVWWGVVAAAAGRGSGASWGLAAVRVAHQTLSRHWTMTPPPPKKTHTLNIHETQTQHTLNTHTQHTHSTHTHNTHTHTPNTHTHTHSTHARTNTRAHTDRGARRLHLAVLGRQGPARRRAAAHPARARARGPLVAGRVRRDRV